MQYASNFFGTENPISEDGHWINGLANGLDWSDARKYASHATGTIVNGVGGNLDDATACLKGAWSPNQYAQARVKTAGVFGTEVEIRLNTTITAHSITGWEIDFGLATGNAGVQIVTWAGPLNVFEVLTSFVPLTINNGDILAGGSLNGVVSAYQNGVRVLQYVFNQFDSAGHWTDGSPGIGFFNSAALGDYDNFGMTNFFASDELDNVTEISTLSLR